MGEVSEICEFDGIFPKKNYALWAIFGGLVRESLPKWPEIRVRILNL